MKLLELGNVLTAQLNWGLNTGTGILKGSKWTIQQIKQDTIRGTVIYILTKAENTTSFGELTQEIKISETQLFNLFDVYPDEEVGNGSIEFKAICNYIHTSASKSILTNDLGKAKSFVKKNGYVGVVCLRRSANSQWETILYFNAAKGGFKRMKTTDKGYVRIKASAKQEVNNFAVKFIEMQMHKVKHLGFYKQKEVRELFEYNIDDWLDGLVEEHTRKRPGPILFKRIAGTLDVTKLHFYYSKEELVKEFIDLFRSMNSSFIKNSRLEVI